MDKQDIIENLCYYDTRHPDHNPDSTVGKREVCYCDNCFYGRSELAEYILELLNKEKEK